MPSVSLSGCLKCIKYSMFVFCLIAWVLGLVALVIGIVARVTGSFGLLDAHIPAIHSGANLLIAVGFFIMIMGFLGCCGTIRESQCLLFSFFLFVFFCFSLLMGAGLWALAWSYKLDGYFYRYLATHVEKYLEDEPQNESTKLMDFLHKKFNCCGLRSSADYTITPNSCKTGSLSPSQLPGCHRVLVDTCQSNLSLICAIGIVFALIMISGMVCSMMLCCALREIS
ncbi:cd9 antigen [Clonorchis sinensis]|uniref:Tetraspanin n=2 Tax=Clonorchis sinensis TaxID=79923 RepID=G7YQ13_CLOSI|nr:cd9 antigen [Clonorchis sinensis]GAA55044.1 CD9 antigen [Clonorchis sinensis]